MRVCVYIYYRVRNKQEEIEDIMVIRLVREGQKEVRKEGRESGASNGGEGIGEDLALYKGEGSLW